MKFLPKLRLLETSGRRAWPGAKHWKENSIFPIKTYPLPSSSCPPPSAFSEKRKKANKTSAVSVIFPNSGQPALPATPPRCPSVLQVWCSFGWRGWKSRDRRSRNQSRALQENHRNEHRTLVHQSEVTSSSNVALNEEQKVSLEKKAFLETWCEISKSSVCTDRSKIILTAFTRGSDVFNSQDVPSRGMLKVGGYKERFQSLTLRLSSRHITCNNE